MYDRCFSYAQNTKEVIDMSLFNGLFRSRDKPQNRTAGSSYSFFIGYETDTGYHHYNIDAANYYEMEE